MGSNHQNIDSNEIERRKQHRREQSDRREIERFGYPITTRRSDSERRNDNDDSEASVSYKQNGSV